MSELTKEQEIKAEMALRPQPDSFEITVGTPGSPRGQISLKVYFDGFEISPEGQPDAKADIKIKNLLKIRGALMKLGVM